MVLAYHGLDIGVDRIRDELDVGRDGVSARALLEAARRYGVSGRGIRVGIHDLRKVSPASILFWNFRHFVVLERGSNRHVDVVDPESGRRRVPIEAVSAAFTGIALEFQPPIALPVSGKSRLRTRIAASPWRYLGKFFPNDRSWIPLIFASLLLLLFNFVTPFFSDYVVDRSQSIRPVPESLKLLTVIAVLVVAFLSLQTARALAIAALQTVAEKRVTLGVLNHLLSLPFDFFARRSAGDLAMRVRTSLDVRRVLTGSALSTLFDGLLIFVYLVLLIAIDVKLSIIVITLAFLQVAILVISWRHQHNLMANTLEFQSQSMAELVEMLDGIATLKAGGLDGIAGERWSHTFAEEVNARVRSSRNLAVTSAVTSSIQFIAPLGVLAFGLMQVANGHTSLGKVIGFSALAMEMFVPLGNLVLTGVQVAGLGRNFTRLGDILEAEPESRGHIALPVGDVGGALELRDVGFRYPGTNREALSGISFFARPGDFIAVLGPSGSGKSTLAAILAGLYAPTNGCAVIDGVNISQLDRSALRRSISFVNQDSRLFAGTIRDNITIAKRGASYDDIVAAADMAKIHYDVQALPMRYETILGPGGIGLSGGQRQRIALARALIRQPRLLILDEATSALDRRTEGEILERLLALDCTLIIITHRLPMACSADEILVISDGIVAERGRHEELVRGDGLYRALAAPGC